MWNPLAAPMHSESMAYRSPAHALRHLLAVAGKLRGLADDMLTVEDDRELFAAAAAALEARAKWMAAALPGDRYDPAMTVHLHRPVNLIV